MQHDVLIYGANGYTGELIAREAKRQGLDVVLAGRHRDRIEPLARQLGFEQRIFDLEHPAEIARQLTGVRTVLHCAGPFSATAAPMMAACLLAKVNYLDITGEIAVFELSRSFAERAKAAGIVICPGVGFDVVPTDCVASALKAALPDASHLALGFDSRSGFSPGTAKTSVEGLAQGGRVRVNGKLTAVPLAYRTRRIDFGAGEKLAMTIPWGDVSTAFYSTGIPNIEVYIPASPKLVKRLKLLNWIRPLLGWSPVQRWLKARVERTVRGPNEFARDKARTWVWGEARNASGMVRTARIEVPNGYTLTVHAALAVVNHLKLGQAKSGHRLAGVYTPSQLVDAGLVGRLPGAGTLQIR